VVFDGFTLVWLVLGIVLMLAELLVPGLVVIFFGMAALLVGGLAALGIVQAWTTAIAVWAVGSLGMVLGLRSGAQRLLPGESDRGATDEDVEAFGEVVEVVEEVGPFESGRIRFRDVTWAAQTIEGRIPAGAKARIVARDNLIWIVEPY
jgi:membrane protein implicated in regulation of membrane protease activity